MTHPTTIEPVPVTLTNPEALAGMGSDHNRKHIRAVYRTFVLTAAAPVLPILAEDLSRFDTWLVAYGNSVVICESQSQAQDPDNQLPGTGNFANTPANPQGTLLYVPPAIAGSQGASLPAFGTATAPGPGTTIAQTAVPPAGTYTVSVLFNIAGTPAQGTDNNNLVLRVNGATFATLADDIAAGPQTFGPYTVTANGVNVISVQNTNAGTAGAIYSVNIIATPAGVAGISPVQMSARWTTATTEVAWATALAFPAWLSMIIHNKVSGY